jgi:hypothetical protein
LIFPPVLRLLSMLLPEEFPFHNNWKMEFCHIAFWEYFPTIDHVVPVALGGRDEKQNWVSTSQIRNSAKSNWRLEDLGWSLLPAGDFNEWDGLMGWFMDFIKENSHHLANTYIKDWHKAAQLALASYKSMPD